MSESRLLRWFGEQLLENSRSFPCLEWVDLRISKDDKNQRGIFAKKPIAKGQVFLRIPLRMCILPARELAHLDPKDQTVSLCRFLIEERRLGETSKWFPYIDALPRDYDLLVCLEDDLRGSPPNPISSALVEELEMASLLFRKLRNGNDFSISEFIWAWATVSSRSCYHPDFASGILVPLGDMLNHRTNEIGSMDGGFVTDQNEKMYEFRAQKDLASDEEIFVSYGFHSNIDLLRWYGFCIHPNPFDELRMELPGPRKEIARQYRVKSRDGLVVDANGEVAYESLQDLRVLVASDEDVSIALQRQSRGEDGPISEANERCVKKYVVSQAQSHISQLDALERWLPKIASISRRQAIQAFLKSQRAIVENTLSLYPHLADSNQAQYSVQSPTK